MLKSAGAILLAGGAALIGILASSEISVRARVIEGFLTALQIMRAEIGSSLTPVCELMEKLSRQTPTPLCEFFRECGEEKKKHPDEAFHLIWTAMLARADYLKISENEKEVIGELGGFLGRYDVDSQLQAISRSERRLTTLSQVVEKDKRRLGGLYAKLGLIGGVAIVIILV